MACIAVYLLFLLSYSYPLIPCRQEQISSLAGSSNPTATCHSSSGGFISKGNLMGDRQRNHKQARTMQPALPKKKDFCKACDKWKEIDLVAT
ncbi:hypothetical protein LX36DRAFT_310214 [Colletotrichum falcatum]|nr:hypothetical protein LX36DRAFT_310214 [Colletotrichum falcatum]